jgi:UTP:GlnB (protein PII) uridylyltransferase
MPRRPSPEFTSAFVDSLPKAYADKYDADVVVAHAAVANQRGDAVAVGLFGRAGNGLCVVANDRPGLLSLISASLVVCQLDVHHAEVYTRELGDGRREAVDLFWVRKLDAPPGSALVQTDAERLQKALVDFIDGRKDPRAAVDRRIAENARPGPAGASDATVRFVADPNGGLATLEVETTDRSGLLFSLASALFSQHVQIVESEVRTVDDRVFDRFRLVEFDGTPISSARRLEIQVAVLTAMEPARRTVPPASG